MRIKKGDQVRVLAGDDRGKTGKVLKVYPGRNRALVEGVNFIKRHSRPSQNNPQGGIVEREASLHLSNLMLMQGDTPTRVGYRRLEDGTKVRYGRKTGEVINR